MKKRVAGGVVLVAVGIGIWLSNLFQGIGPGGSGTNVGMNPQVAVSLDAADVPPEESESSSSSTEGVAAIPAGGLPVVVIDDQVYFLEVRREGTTEYQPTSLDKIVELAKNSRPNADGLRVQIKRRGSSRPSAEAALDAALREAGLQEEQIQRHAGFIE